MSPVTIYTKPFCPFCMRAMFLLRNKGADVTEIANAHVPKVREEMRQRAHGADTFPQIFIGDRHIGGCDDLLALERRGDLDALLAGDAA